MIEGTSDQSTAFARSAHFAALMLLIATVGWGFGFTWAKTVQEEINLQMDLPHDAALGPLLMLGVRFLIGGLLLLLLRQARTGWSSASVRRGLFLGCLLALGMTFQHLGLARTSEAVSAFLTCLTILFVPLMMTFAMRRPPAPLFWLAVALATLGIWMMTGATPAGFGTGELLGLSCAIVFSVHLIAIGILIPRDNPWRMATAQFLIVGVLMLSACAFVDRGIDALQPETLVRLLTHEHVGFNMILLMLFPTFLAFILMSLYQPRLDPTRAALIYLMEPVFAAAYAYFARGRSLGWLGFGGAALILMANLMVEFLNARARRASDRVAQQELATIDSRSN